MGPIKNIEKIPKGKQKHTDKCHCNNASKILFQTRWFTCSFFRLNG